MAGCESVNVILTFFATDMDLASDTSYQGEEICQFI